LNKTKGCLIANFATVPFFQHQLLIQYFDLLCAVDYLRRQYEAPSLLIGHSLGGSAILSIAGEVPEAKAVVTRITRRTDTRKTSLRMMLKTLTSMEPIPLSWPGGYLP
jgi:putative redox protein